LDDMPHGEGRMIYSNGDVYEGMWFIGLRSGYGVVTKRNGDHFEGHWVNDKRVKYKIKLLMIILFYIKFIIRRDKDPIFLLLRIRYLLVNGLMICQRQVYIQK